MKQGILIVITILINLNDADAERAGDNIYHTRPLYKNKPCNNTNDIESSFAPGLSAGYDVQIKRTLNEGTSIRLKFDTKARVTVNESLARLINLNNNIFKLVLLTKIPLLKFTVTGELLLLPPYLISIKINGEENCEVPDLGYFERYPVGAEKKPDIPDLFCGKRKALNQLIINGAVSKPGDWPWHVAIFRIVAASLKYVCGGTLVSDIYVLTAAHCVTINDKAVLPESLGIDLGKHSLIGGDGNSQQREVYKVIVHEDFVHKTLDNDIALLKMKTTVEFNSNIQPACIWYDKAKEKLHSDEVLGTVTGWGFDQTESLSSVLLEATMPIISDSDCIRSKPSLFSTNLDGKKFCAGHRNGTSACNGDSGGGFFVYIPYEDSLFIQKNVEGAWYLRGIVSHGIAKLDTAFCDPNEYVVFTNIAAYTDWIYDHMD